MRTKTPKLRKADGRMDSRVPVDKEKVMRLFSILPPETQIGLVAGLSARMSTMGAPPKAQ